MCYHCPPHRLTGELSLTARQLIPTCQNNHASHSRLCTRCSCLVWQVAISLRISLSLSLSCFSLMSLTNDTLTHSLLYFRGPEVSLLMHLGWRTSPPRPRPLLTHLGACPTITHAICTNCSICVWIWNAIPEYDWKLYLSPERAFEMRDIFYSSLKSPLHLLFVIRCEDSLRIFTHQVLRERSNPIAEATQQTSVGLILVLCSSWYYIKSPWHVSQRIYSLKCSDIGSYCYFHPWWCMMINVCCFCVCVYISFYVGGNTENLQSTMGQKN